MILLISSGGKSVMDDWVRLFAEFAPDLDVRWWHDPTVKPEDVAYVIVWDPEPGRLASFPNLRVIFSSAAGVDNIVRDPHLPPGVPIVRMGIDEIAQRMGEYVCLGALALMRGLKRASTAQAAGTWDYFETAPTAQDIRAGILGLGNLGVRSATMLSGLGFPTAGWSRTAKQVPGVESFAGDDALDAFLTRTDMLVCLLPDTPATRGLIGARVLAKLPSGAGVINAGRGTQLVMADLIAALDSGHISGAMLDVFDPEPLPAGHPAWSHPKIIVTPHLASFGSRRGRARYVADAIAGFGRGAALPNQYDPARGY